MLQIQKLKLSVLEILILIAIVLVAGRSLQPFFQTGFPNTHDGEAHVARVANYAVAIRQGHIPPRIAPTFSNGYSYPVFNYFYPLLSLLGTPAVLVGVHPEVVIKVVLMAVWVSLWVGIFLYIRHLTKSRAAALVGLLVLLISPYLYSLVFVRGAYGELLALAAFVWLLYFIEKRGLAGKTKSLFSLGVIAMSGSLLLAHNIYAMLLFPTAGIYALMRSAKRDWKQMCIEFALGFCLTAFFWIPAVLEKKYVLLDEKLGSFYEKHFVSIGQLLNSKVTFGLSTTDMADTISYGLGLSAIVFFMFASVRLIQSFFKKEKIEKMRWVLVGLALGLVLLMLPIALPVWKVSFVLPYIQFPWRLLGPLGLVLAIIAAHVWSKASRSEVVILSIVVLINVGYVWGWHWPSYNHYDRDYYLNYRQTTTLLNEAQSKTFSVDPSMLSSQRPEIIGAGHIEMGKWRGTYRFYAVVAQESVVVVEPTAYFEGWKVWANGEEIPVDRVMENQGQVAYALPAGRWDVTSKITQQTAPRIIGNLLTIAGILIIGVMKVQYFRQQLQSQKPQKKGKT